MECVFLDGWPVRVLAVAIRILIYAAGKLQTIVLDIRNPATGEMEIVVVCISNVSVLKQFLYRIKI